MIPYGHQDIDRRDLEAVMGVLRSDYLTQGPAVPRFEGNVAAHVKARHGVAVNSATSALHIACLSLGLGPGDRLWTVPNTFVASANCARYCGADVDFVDIDPQTWNMSVPRLRKKLQEGRKRGCLPKVVVPVHFAGQPTEQEEIWALAGEFGFKVLEDASHAIGASRCEEPVGSCKWSHISIFSFHPVKIITTGEGGMALTNDDGLASAMRLLRSHGVTRDPAMLSPYGRDEGSGGGPAGWYYEQQALGYNYRMTDISAALGTSQLDRLGAFVDRRNELARRYGEMLRGLPLRLPTVVPGNRSAFHLYVVRVDAGEGRRTQRQVFDALRIGGVGAGVHYIPVHLQPYYRKMGFRIGQFPEAEDHGRTAISLPLYPGLKDEEQDRVVACLRDAL